jgi:apolipoprotein N-acyltransferase
MWLPIFLSALSGVLLTAGFPKLDLFLLSWIALIPLFMALRGTRRKDAFWLGYIFGLVHYLTTLYWIHQVVARYGGIPFTLSLVILFLLCAYLALYPACFALLAHQWEKHPRLWTWILPCGWVTLEWIRANALTGFPWASLGYTQTPFISLIQVADVTGVFGISALVVFSNTCLMALVNRYRTWGAFLFLVCCILGVLIYGEKRLETIRNLESQTDSWVVGVIQGNIDQFVKWNPAYQEKTLNQYEKISLGATNHLPPPDLLVWPETAAPFFYGIDEKQTFRLQQIVKKTSKALLFGSPAVERVGRQARFMNKAYLLDAQTHLLGQYAKQHLVPFGEYVPLQRILFFVHHMTAAIGTFVPGRDPSPIELNGRAMGILICYEAIFPYLARNTINLGATSLVNLTNDAWFGKSSAPYQHLEMARWRAIEFRVPLIRAANTGISTIIDATGSSCGSIPLNESGSLVCPVRPIRLETVYARWGDWFVWVCVLTTFGAILYSTGVLSMKQRHG